VGSGKREVSVSETVKIRGDNVRQNKSWEKTRILEDDDERGGIENDARP